MLALQLVFLGAIAWTGASSNVSMLLLFALYALLVGGIVVLLPESLLARFRLISRALLLGNRRILWGLVLGSTLLGVLYALGQVSWGDEGRSLRAATIVADAGLVEAYVQSGWLRTKHPPLMPLVFGGTVSLFGAQLLYLRLVSVVFLAGTVVLVYLLGRKLYDERTGLLAAVFFMLFPLSTRVGAAAMLDIQVTFFFVASLLLCLRLVESRSYGQATIAGGLIGLGLLTKYIMILVVGVLVASVFLIRRLREVKRQLALSLLVAICVSGIWLVYAGQHGILSGQIEKILNYSGVYHLVGGGETVELPEDGTEVGEPEPESDSTPNRIRLLGLETMFTRLPASLGVHLLPLMLSGAVLLLRRRTWSDVFVMTWISVVVLALFLTLPDHRYFLVAFPAIAILIANHVRRLPLAGERVLLLGAVLAAGNLYLFIDWARETHLFLS